MGKGEIAHYEQFLLFPQCFQKACFPGASKGVIVWEWVNSLPNDKNLDQSKLKRQFLKTLKDNKINLTWTWKAKNFVCFTLPHWWQHKTVLCTVQIKIRMCSLIWLIYNVHILHSIWDFILQWKCIFSQWKSMIYLFSSERIKRKCWLPAFSYYPQCFQVIFLRVYNNHDCEVKG